MNAPARIDFEAIKREHPLVDIVAASVKLHRAGSELAGCCPFHDDRSPSFRIYANGTRWICHAGCGSGDVLDFIAKQHQVGTTDAVRIVSSGNLPTVHVSAPCERVDRGERLEEARATWRSASPAAGTLAETYLRSRGLYLPVPASIRFAMLPYGKRPALHPTLVAVVANANDQLIGIQRTYLNAAGTGKAAVPKPKLSLGRVSGGAIRLAPAARAMFVTEGLEDGLTLQQEHGRATWVAAGAGNLPSMILPAGVENVVVGGDADQAGEAAARKAVEAFTHRGIRARAVFPLEAKDWNAELMGRVRQ